MFNLYGSPYEENKKHPIRNGLGRLFTRIVNIFYQVTPILIVLRICKVIDIHLDNLVMIWVGYQILDFIMDLIDHAVSKHDEKKIAKEYEEIRTALYHYAEPPTYQADEVDDEGGD